MSKKIEKELFKPETNATIIVNGYLYANPNFDYPAYVLEQSKKIGLVPKNLTQKPVYINLNYESNLELTRRAKQVFTEFIKNEKGSE